MKNIWFKKLPKSRGRNFCDDLWSTLVKLRDENKCMICGSTELINSHHLISRRVFRYRWDTNNGVSVCPKCHEFSLILSFHTSPWSTEEWMKNNRQDQYSKWVENRNNISEEFETEYDEIYYRLEQEYKEKTGNYFRIERISSYLLSLKITEIVNLNLTGTPVKEIAKQMNVSEKLLKEFMKKNKISL